MKKTYSAPMVHAIELDPEAAVCLTMSEAPADMTPAGARLRNRNRKSEMSSRDDIYDDAYDCEFDDE